VPFSCDPPYRPTHKKHAQQLKKIGQQYGNHPAGGGLVVIGVLKLYLDYINLFLLMLRASKR
jgi:FtsH-binding integral membrane protein